VSDVGGRWRRIYSAEWHAGAFHGLSDAERVIYFYCRTGPQSTSVGIYRISTAVAVEDMGNLTAIEFDHRLSVVCEVFDWKFDVATRVLWIPTWLEENPPQSPNVAKSWRKLIANLPDCDLKFDAAAAIVRQLKDWGEDSRKAFGEAFQKPKAQPQAKTGADQGTGESGIFQRSEKQRPGALRAMAEKKTPHEPKPTLIPQVDARVIRIAGDVTRNEPRESTTDYLIDCVQDTCQRQLNLTVTRSQAIVALTKSQEERTA
jgi:hypothetical protein